MSSPITFSGFNNIDFNVVLNSLMAQASLPLTALQTHQSNLNSQSAAIDKLATQLSALQSAADDLSHPDTLAAFTATSTDSSALSTSIGAGAVAGHYDVVVQELAHAQVTASATTAPDATTTAVATGGTLSIGGVTVTVAGSVTLQQLAASINGTAGIGVSASVVRSAANSFRLVLTSHASGVAGAFTVTNGLSGGAGVAFTDTDGNGVSGDSAADNAVTASDAQALVNNVAVTSSSNTLTDVIPGVTLTLTKKDPLATVGVDVTTDSASLGAQVNQFITAYNNLVTFANQQNTSAGQGDATSIGHDPLLRGLRNRLRSVIGAAYSGGVFSRLSEIGVEFTRTGTLQLNDTIFTAAVTDHADDVKTLLAGSSSAFGAITTAIDDYSKSGGFLSTAKSQLTQQASALDRQIATMQDRLAVQRAALQREFTAADAAITQLKNQSSSLANIGTSLTASSTSS